MTLDTARFILQQMLDGVDPTTGEFLPEDHFCHDPTVIRALHTAIVAIMELEEPKSPAVPISADGEDSHLLTKRGRLRADRPWTDEDCETLTQLYRAGLPPESIAPQIHRHKRGVEKQLRYLELMESNKKPAENPEPGLERAGLPWVKSEDERIREMFLGKRSITFMAETLQRSEYAIFCRMEKLGCYGDEPGYPMQDNAATWGKKDNETLRQLYHDGVAVDDIAEHFGRSVASISARLFYLGLTRDCPISLHD